MSLGLNELTEHEITLKFSETNFLLKSEMKWSVQQHFTHYNFLWFSTWQNSFFSNTPKDPNNWSIKHQPGQVGWRLNIYKNWLNFPAIWPTETSGVRAGNSRHVELWLLIVQWLCVPLNSERLWLDAKELICDRSHNNNMKQIAMTMSRNS